MDCLAFYLQLSLPPPKLLRSVLSHRWQKLYPEDLTLLFSLLCSLIRSFRKRPFPKRFLNLVCAPPTGRPDYHSQLHLSISALPKNLMTFAKNQGNFVFHLIRFSDSQRHLPTICFVIVRDNNAMQGKLKCTPSKAGIFFGN